MTAAFTSVGPDDIYNARFPLVIPFALSEAGTKPLAKLIVRYLPDAVIDHIAREHRRGRRLFVGTSNLDARHSVVWNMGAIATSGSPDRYRLFRRVILTSCAIPPVALPTSASGTQGRPINLFLIVDSQLGGDFKLARSGILAIAQRALSLATSAATREQVTTAFLRSRRNGAGFHLSYVDIDFEIRAPRVNFETAYMPRLYAHGEARGEATKWLVAPPSGDPTKP